MGIMNTKIWTLGFLAALLISGCNMPKPAAVSGTADQNSVQIAAEQTLSAYQTQAAPTIAPPTVEIPPSATTQPTETLQPTLTNTVPPPPTNTQAPTPTQIPCNWASFVKDVTYPDGSELAPDADFTKTWRIKNKGSCTWTSGYKLIFDSGDRMNAPDAVQLTSGTVPPGGTVDVSVNLKAPASAGTYQGFFKLKSSDNLVFGVNQSAQDPFWVKIKVGASSGSGPDLRVTSMSFSTNPAKKGVAFTVTVVIKNKGDVAAGAFAVQWWSSSAVMACDWLVPSLGVDEAKTLTCTYKYLSWSTYTAKTVVDPANNVAESNETNNIREETLKVLP
jgi:hypothetical protein